MKHIEEMVLPSPFFVHYWAAIIRRRETLFRYGMPFTVFI